MIKRTLKFGLAGTLSSVAAVFCLQIALAQKTDSQSPPAYAFPKTIKLGLRGKTGDKYKYLSSEKSSSKMTVEGEAGGFSSNDDTDKTYTYQVLGVEPDGNVNLEVKLLQGIEKNTADDGIRRKSMTPGTMIALLKPTLEQLKASFPPSEPLGEVTPGKAPLPPTVELDNEQKSKLSALISSVPYPSKSLSVGDVWKFHTLESKFSSETKFKELEWNGKLAEFVMLGKIPCAKLEISVEFKGKVADVEKNLKQSLPDNAELKGETTIKSKATYLISLDRNFKLEVQAKTTVTLDYSATANGKKTKISGEILIENHDKATEFPEFDSKFVRE